MDRVTVAEAAKRLRISQQAVRQRIYRETLEHEKDAEGNVYVLLSPNTTPYNDVDNAVDNGEVNVVDNAVLLDFVEELKGRIRYLETELERRGEEARRKDHLLAAALERIPALEEPSEPRESPETSSEAAGNGGDDPPNAQEPPPQRSWLYRFFFGDYPGRREDSPRRPS